METIYILFETDVFKSKKSRVFVGAFTSRKLAEIIAVKERIESSISCAVIVPVEINRFQEV